MFICMNLRKRPPCQGHQATPRCEKTCRTGYPKTFSEDKYYGSFNLCAVVLINLTRQSFNEAFKEHVIFVMYRQKGVSSRKRFVTNTDGNNE